MFSCFRGSGTDEADCCNCRAAQRRSSRSSRRCRRAQKICWPTGKLPWRLAKAHLWPKPMHQPPHRQSAQDQLRASLLPRLVRPQARPRRWVPKSPRPLLASLVQVDHRLLSLDRSRHRVDPPRLLHAGSLHRQAQDRHPYLVPPASQPRHPAYPKALTRLHQYPVRA